MNPAAIQRLDELEAEIDDLDGQIAATSRQPELQHHVQALRDRREALAQEVYALDDIGLTLGGAA